MATVPLSPKKRLRLAVGGILVFSCVWINYFSDFSENYIDSIDPTTRRSRRALQNATTEEDTCRTIKPARRPPPDSPAPVFAASYPGSGSKMLWNVIEGLTELWTGDEWFQNGHSLAEEVVSVKTHYPQSNGRKLPWDDEITRAILLLRSPLHAIPSYHNYLYEFQNKLPPHSTRAPVEAWIEWRDSHFMKELAAWQNHLLYWMKKYTEENVLVVSFENLLKGPEEIQKMADFLQPVPAVNSPECIYEKVIQYKSSATPTQKVVESSETKLQNDVSTSQNETDTVLEPAVDESSTASSVTDTDEETLTTDSLVTDTTVTVTDEETKQDTTSPVIVTDETSEITTTDEKTTPDTTSLVAVTDETSELSTVGEETEDTTATVTDETIKSSITSPVTVTDEEETLKDTSSGTLTRTSRLKIPLNERLFGGNVLKDETENTDDISKVKSSVHSRISIPTTSDRKRNRNDEESALSDTTASAASSTGEAVQDVDPFLADQGPLFPVISEEPVSSTVTSTSSSHGLFGDIKIRGEAVADEESRRGLFETIEDEDFGGVHFHGIGGSHFAHYTKQFQHLRFLEEANVASNPHSLRSGPEVKPYTARQLSVVMTALRSVRNAFPDHPTLTSIIESYMAEVLETIPDETTHEISIVEASSSARHNTKD